MPPCSSIVVSDWRGPADPSRGTPQPRSREAGWGASAPNRSARCATSCEAVSSFQTPSRRPPISVSVADLNRTSAASSRTRAEVPCWCPALWSDLHARRARRFLGDLRAAGISARSDPSTPLSGSGGSPSIPKLRPCVPNRGVRPVPRLDTCRNRRRRVPPAAALSAARWPDS